MISLKRLTPYLNNKQLLYNNQYEFKKHRSIFDLLVNLYDNLDEVGEQLCIFYDMTKAFDLLSTLYTY